jgi:ABC-type sugar transport system ATPase subunit
MLSLTEVDKSFGTTHAVKAVTLDAHPGAVLGLAGENGAGKSTLIKMVSGAITPGGGRMTLDGKRIAPRDTNDAILHGISGVFQELTLVGGLSVEQNLFLTATPTNALGMIDRRRLRAMAKEVLARHRLAIDPAARVADLPLGQRQMIEIVRAIERKPRVLLLDEATSALGAKEVEWLAERIAALRRQGVIILFISHRWDEIVHFCDRVAILRNGALVAVSDIDALTEHEAVRLMTGQDSAESAFPEKQPPRDDLILFAGGLTSGALSNVNIELRRGEILGLGGLVGQGQSALLEGLFGAHALTSGEISIAGKAFEHPSPRRAIAAGLAYVPQERKTEGLLLSKSVAVNMTLAVLDRLKSRLGILDLVAEATASRAAIAAGQIRTQGPGEIIANLSGGNQQKVLLQKWLATKPSILLLNDVTRGVDIGTKRQIYALIAELARSGVGIIWYSTDARELVGLVHRVLVMLEGAVNAELTGDAITVDRIVHAAVVASDLRHAR